MISLSSLLHRCRRLFLAALAAEVLLCAVAVSGGGENHSRDAVEFFLPVFDHIPDHLASKHATHHLHGAAAPTEGQMHTVAESFVFGDSTITTVVPTESPTSSSAVPNSGAIASSAIGGTAVLGLGLYVLKRKFSGGKTSDDDDSPIVAITELEASAEEDGDEMTREVTLLTSRSPHEEGEDCPVDVALD